MTPLHLAAKKGDKNAIDQLLQDCYSINQKDDLGQTPLHIAAFEGHVDIVKTLLEDPDINVNVIDDNNWTPLHCAASAGQLKVCAILLNEPRVKVSARSKDGNIPLHYLARQALIPKEKIELYIRIVLLMLKNGADINAQNKQGETPLHEACFRGSAASVMYFIKFTKADVNLTNRNGETCLHYAVRARNKEVVDVLMSMGADPNIVGREGTCKDLARKYELEEIGELLEKNGKYNEYQIMAIDLPVTWCVGIPETIVILDEFERPFTVYRIVVDDGLNTWQVRRRYSNFVELHSKLSQLGALLPPLPPKSIFNQSKEFIENRRQHLEQYLKTLVSDPRLLSSTELSLFLHPPPSDKQSEE